MLWHNRKHEFVEPGSIPSPVNQEGLGISFAVQECPSVSVGSGRIVLETPY